MSSGESLIRRYVLFGYTFENRRDAHGVAFPVGPTLESYEDLPVFHFMGVEALFEDYFAGALSDLPEALRERRSCIGDRLAVGPMDESDRPLWEQIRTQWIAKTAVDPGSDIARVDRRDDKHIGLAPWQMLIDYLEEVKRDRLNPEAWWLFRVPALFFQPREGERDKMASLEERAAMIAARVEPWREIDGATLAGYAEFLGELRARGFFDWRVGRQASNEMPRRRGAQLEQWGFSTLLTYEEAMQRQWYSRLKNVSLEWFRYPADPPPGIPADTWLTRCAAAASDVPAPSTPSADVIVSIDGLRVQLQLRREDGDAPALVAARVIS